ncbi:MAG: ATP-binding protein [Bradymonadia bacterium]
MSNADTLNLSWLLKLRWSLMALQVMLMVGAYVQVALALPWVPLIAVVLIEGASNAAGHLWRRRHPAKSRGFIVTLVALDLVCLTALLYFTGGPFNPFSFLYLVHIALIAVVLPPRLSAALTVMAFGLYGLLFVDHWPLGHHDPHGHHDMSMHMRGMWLAFGLTAGFIAWFLYRITRALASQAEALAEARAKSARLGALATLSAGAAHELSTPLSTIALVARELERDLETGESALDDALEDAALIRAEVARCRAVLDQMASDAGSPAGESPQEISLDDLVHETLDGLPEPLKARVHTTADTGRLRTLPRALSRALRGLVKNALDASTDTVIVKAWFHDHHACFTVRDQGTGMDADTLARAEHPFFTTKSPGEGMGLGLFVTRTLIDQLGGVLTIESAPGEGTTAEVHLPLSVSLEEH